MTPRRVNQCELNTQRASIINSWKENYSASKKQDGKMSTRAGHLIVMTTAAAVLVLIGAALVAHCHYGKRTQYHEQGLHGPKSYKFGFTSGDHKNSQERHEVSDGYGHVKGWYSFVDAHGKHQVVHYEAHPKHGFKVYNHKSKAHNNGKRHYNS